MATAGRILIIPKGRYNEETQYDMLDMVSHGGKGWICKKTCIGIAPEEGEYWAECLDVSEELNGIDSKIDEVEAMVTEETATRENDIAELNNKVDVATNISKGRNQAHVFNTTAEMEAWIADSANKGQWHVGDNIYIVQTDVPDWWVAEVLEEADAETGYYYKIAQLETQKVDLTTIEAELATKVTNSFTGGRAIVSHADGYACASPTTSTEISYLMGATSNIQTQLDGKLPKSGGTLTGKLTTQSVVPSSPNTYACGSLSSPFLSTYAKGHYLLDDNLKNCGQFQVQQAGTTTTEGVSSIWLGNSLAKGTDGNSRGQVVLFNTNSNYAYVYANPNMTTNAGMVLSSKGGTIPTASISGTTLTINI